MTPLQPRHKQDQPTGAAVGNAANPMSRSSPRDSNDAGHQPGPGAPGYRLYKPAIPQQQQAQVEPGTPTHWDDLPA